MKKAHTACFLLVASAVTVFLLSPDEAFAYGGVTGRTRKTSTVGCGGTGCHGTSQGGTVTVTGPSSLAVGQAGTYTVTVQGNTKTGVNIAASDGTLAPGTPSNMILSGGELTFNNAPNTATWTFSYTPTTAGAKTLYVTGDANGKSGPWNFADNFAVTASPATSVNEEQPLTFRLEQNYPNPFNPSTQIEYMLPERNRVRLQVYSVTGSLIATLVDQPQEAGAHSITFRADGLSSGLYLYRLEAGDRTSTKRMLILK